MGQQWTAMESNGLVHYPLWRQKTRDEDMASIIALRVSQVWPGSREDRGLVFFIERFQLM